MPPFLRLVPLPRHLTELSKPVALGIGLAATIPTTAVRIGQQVLTQAVTNGVVLLGRGVELGTSLLCSPLLGNPLSRGGGEDDEDEPFPTYTGLDTSAWGAGDEEAEIVQLFEDAAADEAPPAPEPTVPEPVVPEPATPEPAPHEPPITVEPGLAAAVEDRNEPPATVPSREELPVDGYDGLSATSLRSKVAHLSKPELETVRDYEAGHAKRVTVLSMLERQIAKA